MLIALQVLGGLLMIGLLLGLVGWLGWWAASHRKELSRLRNVLRSLMRFDYRTAYYNEDHEGWAKYRWSVLADEITQRHC